MKIDEKSGNSLCQGILKALIGWKSFPAVLQLGGIEMRAASRIQAALEAWLIESLGIELIVVPEYRLGSGDEELSHQNAKEPRSNSKRKDQYIDYALVRASTVGRPKLEVATVIEAKSNYLGQAVLRDRPLSACHQAQEYANRCGAEFSYVIYIVAAVSCPQAPVPRDAGWAYFKTKNHLKGAETLMDVRGTRIVAKASTHQTNAQVKLPNGVADVWVFVLEGPPEARLE